MDGWALGQCLLQEHGRYVEEEGGPTGKGGDDGEGMDAGGRGHSGAGIVFSCL